LRVSTARTGTQSIDRAAQLLVHVVESAEAPSVGQLAETTGLPKSTTSRLLGALERQGLVKRDGRASVAPGPVLLRFAGAGDHSALIALVAPTLDRLAEMFGETVNLGVATARGVDQLDQRDSRHFIGATNWTGRLVPFHCTAQGKVLLAFGVASLPLGSLARYAPRTIVDPARLEAELEEVRRSGYATTLDELEPGLWAVAVPVVLGRRTVASISLSGPTTRIRPGELERIGRALIDEVQAVTHPSRNANTKRGAA
jgi:IclR family transcriptional regulator, acetate operon repressor